MSYTLDDFTRELAVAVAGETAARARFARNVGAAIRHAREAGVPPTEAVPVVLAAIRQLSDDSVRGMIEEYTRAAIGKVHHG